MCQAAPSFLTIPLELRLQIYSIALDKRLGFNTKYYLCISAVCKQIRGEVLPVVFQDSRYVKSLPHLAKWTSQGNSDLLRHVQNISLHVFQESLSLITAARPTSAVVANDAHPLTVEWWEARYAEQFNPPEPPSADTSSLVISAQERISNALRSPSKPPVRSSPIASAWTALTAIGELKKLWILLQNQNTSTIANYDIEQQLVLDMASQAFPKMQEFTCFSNLLPLSYLRHFHDLRLLRFSGYSKSSPDETLDILRSLPHLDTVIIFRYPELYDKDHAIVTSKLPESLCLTPEVLEQLQPLKRFEISHMTSRIPSQHVTVPILHALRSHQHSLRSLSIRSDAAVDAEFVQELCAFIATSNLTSLSLQLTVPKRCEALLKGDAVFSRRTRNTEVKITPAAARLETLEVNAEAARREWVYVSVTAF